MNTYKYLFLDKYQQGASWPRVIQADNLFSAAIRAKRRSRTRAPCAVILWDETLFWKRAQGQLVHIGRYQQLKPRSTTLWRKPNETYPHPWHRSYPLIVQAHHRGRVPTIGHAPRLVKLKPEV